jgi:nucleotidyltransferase/DNA polymerase involved in DNA repair
MLPTCRIHCDFDAFYASCEELLTPSLRGKPFAVGSTYMISTASYEARKFGVRSAMPGFIAQRLCPQIIFVKHRFDVYRAKSEEAKVSKGRFVEKKKRDRRHCPPSLAALHLILFRFSFI